MSQPDPAIAVTPEDEKCWFELEAELNRRNNPERTRRFDRELFIKSQSRLQAICQASNLPGDALRISIVGSNGKGSTATLLARLAAQRCTMTQTTIDEGGKELQIGLYSSPHLLSPLERIKVNNEPVAATRLMSGLLRLKDSGGENLNDTSYFELLTLLSLEEFRARSCQLQIYEAGLGGRYDATRQARPQVVILTRLALEHCEILGDTLTEILNEKLAIVGGETRLVIALADERIAESEFRTAIRQSGRDIALEFFQGPAQLLKSSYLEYNARFANFCLEQMNKHEILSEHNLRLFPKESDQLKRIEIPGRLEKVTLELNGPRHLYFDNAHNPSALELTLRNLRDSDLTAPGETLAILGLTVERPLEPMIEKIAAAGISRLILLNSAELNSNFSGPFRFAGLELNISSCRPSELTYHLRPQLKSGISSILFVGSHLIYKYFKQTINDLQKSS